MNRLSLKVTTSFIIAAHVICLSACSGNFQNKPSDAFVQTTKPIIYELASVLNEVLSQGVDSHTYGETREACEKNLKLLTEIRKRLLVITPKNKKDNEIFSSMNEMTLNLEKILELNKKDTQYELDNMDTKDQIDAKQASGGDATELTNQYKIKQNAIQSIRTVELPQLWQIFSERSTPLFKKYEPVYGYDVQSILPVFQRYEQRQKVAKHNLEQALALPLDLPEPQGSTPFIVYLTDSIKAISLVNQGRIEADSFSGNGGELENFVNQSKKAVRLYKGAVSLLLRSPYSERILNSPKEKLSNEEKVTHGYLSGTIDVLKKMVTEYEARNAAIEKISKPDSNDPTVVESAKNIEEFRNIVIELVPKFESLWFTYVVNQFPLMTTYVRTNKSVEKNTLALNQIYFMTTYVRTKKSVDKIELVTDDLQTEQLLGLIKKEFNNEIATLNNEIISSPSSAFNKSYSYVFVLIMYRNIEQLYFVRKYEDAKADLSQLEWEQVKDFGIYRTADNVGRVAIREAYYNFKSKKLSATPHLSKDKLEEAEEQVFYNAHPL